jgi:FkbM family methyltransferase
MESIDVGILNKLLRRINVLIGNVDYHKTSFSQCGEDLIIRFIFDRIGIQKPSYIDIGAHHPFFLSNTAIFYKSGSCGINIEPDPALFKKIAAKRKRDINLNIGLAPSIGTMNFYRMNPSTLSTFSREEAIVLQKEAGYQLSTIEKIPVDNLENIIKKYHADVFPDFLSLDVEGLELDILKQIDFKNNYPKVLCLETLSSSTLFSNTNDLFLKDEELIDFVLRFDYKVYADTLINTIFVKNNLIR